MKNITQRLITGIIIATLTILIAYKGHLYYTLFCISLGALTFVEYINITKTYYNNNLIKISGVFYILFSFAVLSKMAFIYIFALICLFGFILLLITYLNKKINFWVPFGFIYNSLPILALIFIRNVSFSYIIYLFSIVWSTDIGGYVFGKLIGGKKLAPKISPKKTYAGFIGGLIIAFVVTSAYLYLIHNITSILVFGIFILSIISQYGDLFESFIKRKFNVKDSGNILPGHGGILDRVDGLIIAAIAMSMMLQFI